MRNLVLLTGLFLSQSIAEECPKPQFQFDRNFTGVVLDPYIAIQSRIEDPYSLDTFAMSTILEKVKTKFDHIFVNFYTATHYEKDSNELSKKIPKLAAQLNRERNFSYFKLSIKHDLFSYGLAWWTSYNKSVPEIKKSLDEANSIFPGTIHNLILKINSELKSTISVVEQISHFLNASKTFNEYKILLMFKIKYCSNDTNVISHLNDTWQEIKLNFPHFDTIYFESDGTEWDTKLNTAPQLDQCISAMNKIDPNVNIGFVALIPEDKLINTWKKLNHYARTHKVFIFLNSAFDTFHPRHPLILRTNGWWTLVQNSSYGKTTTPFKFKEKSCLQIGINTTKNDPLMQKWLSSKTKFSRENFAVIFDLFVANYDGVEANKDSAGSILFASLATLEEIDLEYQIKKASNWHFTSQLNNTNVKNDLPVLLELVATKFSKIVIIPRSLVVNNQTQQRYSKLLISTQQIAANLNKNKNLAIDLTVLVPKENAIETIQAARQANTIHPRTVNRLVYDYDQFGINSTFKFNQIHSLLVGLSLKLETCFNPLLPKILSDAKNNHISFFLFTSAINYDETLKVVGFERLSQKYSTMFELCIQNVYDLSHKHFRSENVWFLTSWPNQNDQRDLLNFVKYWEFMNAWAIRWNITVVMKSAFDSFDLRAKPNYLFEEELFYGWWRIKEGVIRPTQITMETFEDKKQVALNIFGEMPVEDKLKGIGQLEIIIITLSLLFLILASFLLAYYLRKKRILLTSSEVQYFFNGAEGDANPAEILPYDSKLEIEAGSFSIGNELIGSGQFGRVYKGTVTQGSIEINVAIKMIKRENKMSDIIGLLSEIKILSYLGKHENIVELVGANTVRLNRRQLLVFTQLCELGSLYGYLRKMEQKIEGKAEESGEEKCKSIDENLLMDLCKWSTEIASGLEFISSKKIIHLDIATRNVLLSASKQAKLADFGLSRRLQNYQLYVKNTQEPLPWRWMAPEALQECQFSEKSDVWSFGVALWEIFSLGDMPFPGLSWDINFANYLKAGLRLGSPRYNYDSIYTIMLTCWQIKPEQRPTATELKLKLNEIHLRLITKYARCDGNQVSAPPIAVSQQQYQYDKIL